MKVVVILRPRKGVGVPDLLPHLVAEEHGMDMRLPSAWGGAPDDSAKEVS